MEIQQTKQRAQEQDFIQDRVERDALFWAMTTLDIAINHLISSDIPPFVVTQESHACADDHSDHQNDDQIPAHKIQGALIYNRKEKSLSELTKKFIDKFQGSSSPILALDQVTKQMNVERRRIYDIINIMESLNVVAKIKKNIYEWKGLREAIKTVNNFNKVESETESQTFLGRKQKSLECLAVQFLKIFSKNRSVLTLQKVSNYLLSDSNDEVKKTKIRRLYDIVNVFKCLGLVKKVKTQGSKPGYQWMGPSMLQKIVIEKQSAEQSIAGELQFVNDYINSPKTQISTKVCQDQSRKAYSNEAYLMPEEQKFQIEDSTFFRREKNSSKGTKASPKVTCSQFKVFNCDQIHEQSNNFDQQSDQMQNQLCRARTVQQERKNYPESELFAAEYENHSFLGGLIRSFQRSGVDSLDGIINKFEENLWDCDGETRQTKKQISLSRAY